MLYLFCSTIYTFLLGEQDSTFRKKSFRAAGPLVFGFSCQQEYFSEKGEKLIKKNLVALRLQRVATVGLWGGGLRWIIEEAQTQNVPFHDWRYI